MRKLATIQTITSISPIPNADRIETAKVLGWNIVVGRNEFSVGQKAVYFEIDSFLRGDNPAFETFLSRGTRTIAIDGVDVEGHVLRTVKLRGVISQGLLMPLEKLGLSDDLSVGTDVTEQLNVLKWEPPLPVGNGEIVGPFDTRFAPKTDAIRVQSIADRWDLIRQVAWEPTLKVDGTSQTLINDDGTLRIFGRNWELSSDAAAGFKIATRDGLTNAILPGMAVQFELVGVGIQANRLKLQGQKSVVFAVWQDGVKLPRNEWPEDILALATPVLGDEWLPTSFASADELVDAVDGLRGSFTKDVLDEGIVFHPVDPDSVPEDLASVLDRNNNWKVINNKFLIKHGE